MVSRRRTTIHSHIITRWLHSNSIPMKNPVPSTAQGGRGREGEREREGGREGGREREGERGREGGREGEREGGRAGGREREREITAGSSLGVWSHLPTVSIGWAYSATIPKGAWK